MEQPLPPLVGTSIHKYGYFASLIEPEATAFEVDETLSGPSIACK